MKYFNLRGQNDSTYPTLAMRFSADRIEAVKADGSIRTISLTNFQVNVNATVAAPAYKDQAGSFLPGQEIHFYAIAGSAVTPSGISSLRPPSIGPNLDGTGYLTGYDAWCYLTSIRVSPDGLLPVWVRDNQVFFENSSYYPVFLLKSDYSTTEGHATIWTGVDVSPCIPSLSMSYLAFVDAQLQCNAGMPQGALLLNLKVNPTAHPDECCAVVSCAVTSQSASSFNAQDYTESLPTPTPDGNGKLWLYYKWIDIAHSEFITGRHFSLYMRGYSLPR